MTKLFGICASLCALLATNFIGPAFAASSNRVDTEYASSIFRAEHAAFVPGRTTWLAFSQKLEPGWHVYWKNPGDSGLALDLRWRLPEGFSAGEVVYPTPERIPVGPLANFGHHGAPVFLVPVSVDDSVATGAAAEISVDATWLICEEICVPEEGAFTLAMPVAPLADADPAGAALVAAARAAAPEALSGDAVFAARPDRLILSLDAPEGFSGAEPKQPLFFFPEAEGLIEPAAEQVISIAEGRITVSMAPGFAYDADGIETLSGVIAEVAAESGAPPRGYALAASREDALAPAIAGSSDNAGRASGAAGGNLGLLLAAAFFGGVLLNVMPCVFPVIFIKAASLMNSAQGAGVGAARRHGVLYTTGVVATFAAIGGALLALRAGGEQLGWGFHLQSPVIVALSAYVLFLVGLNLSGVFEIGENLQGAGAGLASKSGDLGAFFTGALAVLVAAPCIGPLLSAPMGAAVMLPAAWGMAIFIAMALGLAAPYLVVSFAPALGRRLPKPGAWMKIFKQALAFPVFAAAAYFLWVLAQQTGGAGLATALGGAVLLAFAAWAFQLSKGEGLRAVILRAAAALAALFALAPVFQMSPATVAVARAGGAHGALDAVPFDAAMIDAYRAEGRPVFVDFTAAWCVTCQFNKATIFSRRSLAGAFESQGVTVMVADWTARDPEITKALEAFGANGVPLYVYYPQEGAPEVLSLPLTERAILEAIGREPA